MRLFVDVDDTLIIYDQPPPNPYGYYQGISWRVNQTLLDGIHRFHADNPENQIIIWSGGGKEYSEILIDRFGLTGLVEGMLKDQWSLSLIRDGDIVVDDLDEPWRTHSPDQWPSEQSPPLVRDSPASVDGTRAVPAGHLEGLDSRET